MNKLDHKEPKRSWRMSKNRLNKPHRTKQKETQEAHSKTTQKTRKMPTGMVINIIQQNNNTNPSHVPEYRSENSQNYFQASTQQTIKTPQQAILSQNQNEFGENLHSSLNQSGLMAPKPQRLQKNGGVRRNIMRSRNVGQNREPQDVCLLEMSKSHQQSNWWSTNQPDATSYLQLPPRKFQDQRKQVVNYDEEEDLSWCNKCGEPGHI